MRNFMQMPDTPLFVKTHDFVLWLLRHTQRFIRRMRRQRDDYSAGAIDAAQIRQSLHAWLGHTSAVTEAQVLKVLLRQHCVFSR